MSKGVIRSLLPLALVVAPVFGQTQRLVDTIARPLAYLCLEAMPPLANARPGAERQPGPVHRLLADPSLEVLFTGGAENREPATGSTRALGLVRGLLGRSLGEIELVLTGIVPADGQPLLVLRARLPVAAADNLQLALDKNELGEASRKVAGTTTYRLRGDGTAAAPGQDVELALVGADLVIGNDTSAIREVLEAPAAGNTAAAPREGVLSGDATFRAMKKQLPVAGGSLWMFGDWQRLGDRVGGDAKGMPAWLMGSSGLGSARAVMAAVSPGAAGAADRPDYTATLLLDFAADHDGAGRRGPGRHGPGGPDHDHEPDGITGWFRSVKPVPVRTLLAELPAGGLGGLVLSVDLRRAFTSSHDGSHFYSDLRIAFEEYGLDLDRNVMSRLGEHGTLQFHVGTSAAGTAAVDAVYSIRTKNKKAASDLFADLRRVCEKSKLGVGVARDGKDPKDRRVHELIEVRHHDLTMFLTAHEDALLFTSDADTLVAVVDELRRNKPRAKKGEPIAAAVTAAGTGNVAGLFDVDLQPLFDHISTAFAGVGVRVDLSTLPRRHVGHLDLQPHDEGTTVRVRVLSSK
ncbi:MAG: hypothetical protein JNK15_02055 [Planctomycetes bacterium]|nr:hypothetical protein [Planctomycetota bacterium]